MGITFAELKKKYKFLEVNQPENGEEFEVTKEAIEYVKKKYPYYKEYSVVNRRQMTTKGWALSKNLIKVVDPNFLPSIDVVCDVITTGRSFETETDTHRLDIIYHTVGNFIPIPEGANYGGRSGKHEGYNYKLRKIKKYFDEDRPIISEAEIKNVENRLKSGYPLGSVRISKLQEKGLEPFKDSVQLRYWIQKKWIEKGRKWEDYVKGNYLQDFVDGYYKPLEFDKHNVEKSIELIIKRGYRIDNKLAADENVIKEIMNELNSL